jgi:hypothetical protein
MAALVLIVLLYCGLRAHAGYVARRPSWIPGGSSAIRKYPFLHSRQPHKNAAKLGSCPKIADSKTYQEGPIENQVSSHSEIVQSQKLNSRS